MLSRKLRKEAQEGNLEGVFTLLESREKLMKRVDTAGGVGVLDSREEAAEIHRVLTEVQEIDTEVEALLTKEAGAVRQDLDVLSRGRKAVRAYKTISGR